MMLTLFIVGLLRVAYFAIARYFVRSHFTRSLSTCRNRDEALVRQLMDRFVTVTCLSLRSTVPWMIQHTQSCVVAAEDAAALRLRSFGLSACTPSLEKKNTGDTGSSSSRVYVQCPNVAKDLCSTSKNVRTTLSANNGSYQGLIGVSEA
jgi:hypothetical protein